MGASGYDAFLLLSFGGPEGPPDVLPFLERVTRGRNVPPERLRAVAGNYARFGGVSPINAANRALLAAVAARLPHLPVYWGNRNWHPLIEETVTQMTADGVRRAACFVTSAYRGYSACDQYLEDLARARRVAGPGAPAIDKLPPFFDHPGFVGPMADNAAAALRQRGAGARLVFTAHSVPLEQAEPYASEVRTASTLVAQRLGRGDWDVVWQSRSGPPSQPWLEPDVSTHLETLAAEGITDVALVPIGFVSDHIEVRYDLDVVAAATAERVGLRLARAATVGTADAFVEMIAELVTGTGG